MFQVLVYFSIRYALNSPYLFTENARLIKKLNVKQQEILEGIFKDNEKITSYWSPTIFSLLSILYRHRQRVKDLFPNDITEEEVIPPELNVIEFPSLVSITTNFIKKHIFANTAQELTSDTQEKLQEKTSKFKLKKNRNDFKPDEILNFLLQACVTKEDIATIRDKEGRNILHLLLLFDAPLALIQPLYSMSPEFRSNSNDLYQNNYLHYAAQHCNVETIKFFLYKVNANIVNFNNELPLHMAAQSGNEASFELLVENTIDITQPGFYGNLLTHYAAIGGNLDLLKVVLEKSPNINERNLFNENLLYCLLAKREQHGFAKTKEKLEQTAVFLIDNGADLNTRSLETNFSALDLILGQYREIKLSTPIELSSLVDHQRVKENISLYDKIPNFIAVPSYITMLYKFITAFTSIYNNVPFDIFRNPYALYPCVILRSSDIDTLMSHEKKQMLENYCEDFPSVVLHTLFIVAALYFLTIIPAETPVPESQVEDESSDEELPELEEDILSNELRR